MANRNIDLNSQEWLDLIFEGKNKDFGAYVLREDSAKRHIKALIIVVATAVLAFLLPKLIATVIPERGIDDQVGPIVMTQFDPLDQVKEEQIIRQPEAPPPPELKSSIKFVPPVIKKDEEVRDENEVKTQLELTDTKAAISVADVKGKDDGSGVDIADLPDNKVIVAEKEQIFTSVEQMPQFPGGEGELMKYLRENIKYPVVAAEAGIQGKVVLRFVVGKNGEVTDVIVQRSLDPSCDKEAIRVIKSMPKWVPGKQNGTPVMVYYTVPVTFRLQ